MSDCDVQGCGRQAVEIVRLNSEDEPLMETSVCVEHALDLRAGGDFEFGERREILMGDSLPLQLVSYTISDDMAGQTIVLMLGRGPEIAQRVTMRVAADFVMGTPDDAWARAMINSWPKEE
jgi:hypothetical protein